MILNGLIKQKNNQPIITNYNVLEKPNKYLNQLHFKFVQWIVKFNYGNSGR